MKYPSKLDSDELSSDWSSLSDDDYEYIYSDNHSEQGKYSSNSSDWDNEENETIKDAKETPILSDQKIFSDAFYAKLQISAPKFADKENNNTFMLPPSYSLFSNDDLLRPKDNDCFGCKTVKQEVHPESILRFLQKNIKGTGL